MDTWSADDIIDSYKTQLVGFKVKAIRIAESNNIPFVNAENDVPKRLKLK